MTNKEREARGAVHCYTALCPDCGEARGVVVAPFDDRQQLARAVETTKEWERDGYRIGDCTCADVWAGLVKLDHKPECVRTVSEAKQGALL